MKLPIYGRTIVDCELLASHLFTRHFTYAIEGRFSTLRTDQRSLMFIFSEKVEKRVDMVTKGYTLC